MCWPPRVCLKTEDLEFPSNADACQEKPLNKRKGRKYFPRWNPPNPPHLSPAGVGNHNIMLLLFVIFVPHIQCSSYPSVTWLDRTALTNGDLESCSYANIISFHPKLHCQHFLHIFIFNLWYKSCQSTSHQSFSITASSYRIDESAAVQVLPHVGNIFAM